MQVVNKKHVVVEQLETLRNLYRLVRFVEDSQDLKLGKN